MIKKLTHTISLILLCALMSCKPHDPDISDTLKHAYAVQQTGVLEAKRLDSLLSTYDNSPFKEQMKNALSDLLGQRIVIQALEPHDHKHCTGHHHGNETGLTDEDLLTTQEVWRDSVFALSTTITNYYDAK